MAASRNEKGQSKGLNNSLMLPTVQSMSQHDSLLSSHFSSWVGWNLPTHSCMLQSQKDYVNAKPERTQIIQCSIFHSADEAPEDQRGEETCREPKQSVTSPDSCSWSLLLLSSFPSPGCTLTRSHFPLFPFPSSFPVRILKDLSLLQQP